MQTKSNKIDQIHRILTTPILASAADNYIYKFSEAATFIILLQGEQAFKNYLKSLFGYIRTALNSLKVLLGTEDFDSLDIINLENINPATATNGVVFTEMEDKPRQELCLRLKKQDQLWVLIAKLHCYLEMWDWCD